MTPRYGLRHLIPYSRRRFLIVYPLTGALADLGYQAQDKLVASAVGNLSRKLMKFSCLRDVTRGTPQCGLSSYVPNKVTRFFFLFFLREWVDIATLVR